MADTNKETSSTAVATQEDRSQSVCESFVVALADRDPSKLAACLDSNVKLRSLVPSGLVQREGVEDVVPQLLVWFAEADRIELLRKQVYPVSLLNHVGYRFREVHAGGESEVIEQEAFCSVRDGLILSIDMVCSGHLTDRSVTAGKPFHHRYDAGDLGCSSELPQEFRRRIGSIPIGEVLDITTRDPSAREDLPSLARLLGHKVLLVNGVGGTTVVSVQRKR